MTPQADPRICRFREQQHIDHANALQADLMRPTENMRWLGNAGRVMAENKERWAKEDAINERQERTA
jgi:hypothetical protein